MILADLQEALARGRSPLLLTERVHLDYFAKAPADRPQRPCSAGRDGARQRRALAEKLVAIPDGEKRVLLSTGRYIGEGFDDARLDTLFLALPISWRGTLQQYAGRLHRLHDRKRVIQIYDYVDARVPVLANVRKKN